MIPEIFEMAKSAGGKAKATAELLKKLGVLALLGTMDGWKLFLTIRNFAKTLTVQPTADMTALQADYGGQPKHRYTSEATGISNFFELMFIIPFIALDRFCRITFRLNALHWDIIKREADLDIPVIHYIITNMIFNIIPVYTFRLLSVCVLDGYFIRRKVLMLREAFELMFINGWILVLTGLANNEELDSWIYGAVAVVVAVQGYIFWEICIAAEGGVFHEELQDKTISDKLKTLWDFPTDQIVISERANWEVKYVGAIGVDVLVIASNVISQLPPEHVCALASMELGQWDCRHSVVYYFLPLLRTAILGALLMGCYDNSKINELFGFTSEPDPVVPMFNAYMWIWPCVQELLNSIESLFSYWIVREGDFLASERHSVAELTAALNHVAGSTELYPIYDGWYSAWLLGRPIVKSRIQWLNRLNRRKK